jgi:polar amino acid transport system permease protein
MAGALRSIAPGHREAAAALGLPALRTLRRILLPQALPIMLPTMTGLLIGLFKDSALLAVVSVPEFMFAARQVIAETYAPLEVYATVALAYWLLSLVCAAVGSRLEQHLGAYQRRAAAPSMPSTSQPAP